MTPDRQGPAAQAEVQSLLNRGYELLLAGRPEEAVQIFESARAASGATTKEISAGLGMALLLNLQAAEALPLLERAIAQNFAPAEVRVAHIRALNRLGRHLEGLKASEKYVAFTQRSPASLFFHSEQLLRVGRLKEAAAMMGEALSRDPRLREQNIDRLLGAWIASGDYATAIKVLFQILGRSPDSEQFQTLLTHCLETTDFADRAVAIARGEESLAGAVEYFQAAVFLDRANALEDAMRALEKCSALQPQSLLVKGLKARIMLRLGRTVEAASLQKEIWAEALGLIRAPSSNSAALVVRESKRPIGPIVYLPVELEGRELQSRLLLALEILKRGYIPVILSYALLTAQPDVLPQGIVLYKSYNGLDQGLLSTLHKAGNIVAVIDEEAFGWTGDANVMQRSAGINNLVYCAAVFAPGDVYVEALKEVVHDAAKALIPSGNPRIDFYRADLQHIFADECQTLRQTIGPHVLLCTNFGGWNSAAHSYVAVCKAALSASSCRNDARGAWTVEIYQDAAEVECRGTQAIIDVVEALGREMPDRKVVLRPHPAEDVATWRHVLQHCPNVMVLEGGSLAACMMAADAVVHLPGCGTGVEAWLARRPSISLDFFPDLKYPRIGLSSQTSAIANNMSDLIALVRRACDDPAEMLAEAQTKADIVRRHVPFEGERVSTRIAAHLGELLASTTPPPSYADAKRATGNVASALKVLHSEEKVRPRKNIRREKAKRIAARPADINRMLMMMDPLASNVRIDSPVDGAFILTLK